MAHPTVARALTILEAVRLTSDVDIPALQQLLLSGILGTNLILRILLTFLPEGTDPENYIGLLKNLPSESSPRSPDYSKYPSLDISGEEACRRVKKLHLTPLAPPQYPAAERTDPLTLFLIHQAYRIEADTGCLTDVVQLLQPFVELSDFLRSWMIASLLPPLRFNYEYYPQSNVPLTIDNLERMGEGNAIQTLLSKAAEKSTSEERVEVGRDLRGLVGPWMYGETSRKRRKVEHSKDDESSLIKISSTSAPVIDEGRVDSAWAYVNGWIFDLGTRDFPRAVDAFVQWNGPGDVDYGTWGEKLESMTPDELSRDYAQAGLAVVYCTHQASMETIIGSHRALLKAVKIMNLDEPPDLKRSDEPAPSGIPAELYASLSRTHLLHNTLLQPRNPLTSPTAHSVVLLNLILSSVYKLLNLGNVKSIRDTCQLCLFATEHEQKMELHRTLYKLRSERMDHQVWISVRKQLLWLHDWEKIVGTDTAEPRGVFSKLPKAELENEILRALLDGGCHTLAFDIYCNEPEMPLSEETVEDTALSAALAAYDAASNGNRTRGGVRKAADIIATFSVFFPNSKRFAQTAALLSATHAMSFYSLSLQRGVPFQPVNIRAHKDPMSLIGKVLEQNSRSYTHLDDLLEIGLNLVTAGLSQSEQAKQGSPPGEDAATNARQRVTRMAIEAALAEDDFDTAYSYVVNRLSPGGPLTEGSAPIVHDDISWRAAYAAGRYPMSNADGSAIRRLDQRMELLAQALLLAPAWALADILKVWQQCELRLTELIAEDAAEDDSWDKETQQVPGGFSVAGHRVLQKARDPTRSALQEEAPMGLFEVARGAASALSKHAFPLHGPQKGGAPSAATLARSGSMGSMEGSGSDGGGMEGTNRVRKRDMVSNMVTGGLASGIGWVIGKSWLDIICFLPSFFCVVVVAVVAVY